MAFLHMPVKAIVSHIGFAIWEPAVEELVLGIQNRLWFLEPMDLFCLLTPELLHIFNRISVELITLWVVKGTIFLIEDIRRILFNLCTSRVESLQIDICMFLLEVQSWTKAHGTNTAATTVYALLS